MVDDDVHGDVTEISTNQTENMIDAIQNNDFQLQMTRFVVQKILVPIATFVGVFGNVMSITVLIQRSMTSSTNCYLAALSVFDLLYLIFSFTLSWNHYKPIKNSDLFKYWFPVGRVFADMCSNVSVYLTLTFSFERLIAVRYPMKGRIICTPQRARIISLVVVFVVSACTSLEFLEWRTVKIINNNITMVTIVDTDFANTYFYRIGYHYFLIIFFTFLPLLLLGTFNGLLIRSVLEAMKIRRQMTCVTSQPPSETSRRHHEQQRITAMLIGVVVIFLVCQTPNAILLGYYIYIDLGDASLQPWQRNSLRIAGNVVNFLILLNASVNFIIYSFMSTKFRRVFLKIFCRYSSPSKHITRNYSSYYGNSTMTSKLPRSSIRFPEIGTGHRNGHSNRISSRCVHPAGTNSSSEQHDFMTKRSSFIQDVIDTAVHRTKTRHFARGKGNKNSFDRRHVKYHMSSTGIRGSDSEEAISSGQDLSLEEMAKARDRNSRRCQCFHITSPKCLEDGESNSCQSKMADTSI